MPTEDFNVATIILSRVFSEQGQLPSEAEKVVIKPLQTALAAHRGAAHSLSLLENYHSLDKQRTIDEIARLHGRLESTDLDLERTAIHENQWAKACIAIYQEIVQPITTTE